jgi:hypothetical protein
MKNFGKNRLFFLLLAVSLAFFPLNSAIAVSTPDNLGSADSVPPEPPGDSSYHEGTFNYYVPYFNFMEDCWTGICITNCGNEETSLAITIYDKDGTELTKEAATIAANGQTAKAVGTDLQTPGWVEINSHQPLSGLSFLGTSDLNHVMIGSPFINKLSTRLRAPHIAQDQTWDTAVMVCNPNTAATTLTIICFADDGSRVAESTKEIPANGYGSYSLGELFTAAVLSGSIEIKASLGVAAFIVYSDFKNGGRYFAGINAMPDYSSSQEKMYTGTLTVLQKDAYSNVAGRSSNLWPPHTTTVFKWENGEEIHVNHGTAPDEIDASGTPFLVEQKVYSFTGTRKQLETLQAAYRRADFDDGTDTNKFLGMSEAKTSLEKAFLAGLIDYIADGANGLYCTGSGTVNDLTALLKAGKFHEFIDAIANCNWTRSDWETALLTVLEDTIIEEGHSLTQYHVCNDDADLQVRLIKTFIADGSIKMPEKINNGPMLFYSPE